MGTGRVRHRFLSKLYDDDEAQAVRSPLQALNPRHLDTYLHQHESFQGKQSYLPKILLITRNLVQLHLHEPIRHPGSTALSPRHVPRAKGIKSSQRKSEAPAAVRQCHDLTPKK